MCAADGCPRRSAPRSTATSSRAPSGNGASVKSPECFAPGILLSLREINSLDSGVTVGLENLLGI